MLFQTLLALIPHDKNLSFEEILESTLEAERILSTKTTGTSLECRQACCLEYVIRKKVNDADARLNSNDLATSIGMTVKKFKEVQNKLSFRLDTIVLPQSTSSSKNIKKRTRNEDIVAELSVKLGQTLGDCSSIVNRTREALRSIKKAMQNDDTKNRRQSNLAFWKSKDTLYQSACFYLIAKDSKHNYTLSTSDVCRVTKTLESDFDKAVKYVKQWLEEVSRMSYDDIQIEENNNQLKEEENIIVQSGDDDDNSMADDNSSTIQNEDNNTVDDNRRSPTMIKEVSDYSSTFSCTTSISSHSIYSPQQVISQDTGIKDEALNNLESTRKRKLLLVEAPCERYVKRKKQILDDAVERVRKEQNNENLDREKALAIAAHAVFVKFGLIK